MRMIRTGLGISGIIAVLCGLWYGIEGARAVFGAGAPWVLAAAGLAIYVWTIWYAARFPDLELDDPNAPILHLPRTWEVTRTGIDFVIPLVVLLWCLMVEEMSPGLSAFWATVTIIGILATRKPLLALFRRQDIPAAVHGATADLVDGLSLGARNMIGIAVATATAGIVVGTITLTGLGLMMTDFVEFVSAGNVMVMLVLIAVISLVLGMGIPTTANYILVATLMAPVVVELAHKPGSRSAHRRASVRVLFRDHGRYHSARRTCRLCGGGDFEEDPIATGFQGSLYSLRTAILPFVFIFNPEILLIDIGGWWHLIWVIFISLAAILLFSAVTMNWFITKSRLWESRGPAPLLLHPVPARLVARPVLSTLCGAAGVGIVQ